MRIRCPFCGEREVSEFAYCRTWLRVTRDTLTHEILAVQFARGELRAVEPSPAR
jgi:sarcosine oxidase delta subunit